MDTIGIYLAILVMASASIAVQASYEDSGLTPYNTPCDVSKDVTEEYRAAIYEFVIATYKKASTLNNFHVVYSPLTMWTVLAAIVEGVDPETQKELFKVLNLPDDICVRQQYYKVATSLFWPGEDIRISNSKYFVFDEELTINRDWREFVTKNSLLEVNTAPIKSNPQKTIDEMKKMVSGELKSINLEGNSVILEAMDFSGLWTAEFSGAVVEQAPFYSPDGKKLGAVDLMRMRKRVRMGYASHIQMKLVELPVGTDGRYSLIYGMVLGDANELPNMKSWNGTTIHESLASLRESDIPLDVAIPRLTMTSEFDAKVILEDMGLKGLWTDSSVTRPISEPAALPGSYIQRVTISMDTAGVNSTPLVPESPADTPTGLDPMVGRDFIANKPYMFGIYDKKTRTCLMAAIVAKPTYPL